MTSLPIGSTWNTLHSSPASIRPLRASVLCLLSIVLSMFVGACSRNPPPLAELSSHPASVDALVTGVGDLEPQAIIVGREERVERRGFDPTPTSSSSDAARPRGSDASPPIPYSDIVVRVDRVLLDRTDRGLAPGGSLIVQEIGELEPDWRPGGRPVMYVLVPLSSTGGKKLGPLAGDRGKIELADDGIRFGDGTPVPFAEGMSAGQLIDAVRAAIEGR